jgi:hypothetical protein
MSIEQSSEVAEASVVLNNTAPVVEGKIEERKFESILTHEFFSRKEGHGYARTAAVALIGLALLPILALYDLVRLGLFKAGKLDGKSWSLITKADAAVQSLAARVEAARAKKEPTLAEINAKSEQSMKSHVEKIVAGYRKEQGGWIGHTFDSSCALAGERQIVRGQQELVKAIAEYLEHNAKRAEDVAPHLASVKKYLGELFIDAAEDDFYVENKMERKGPRPSLSSVAQRELEAVLQGHPVIAERFLDQVKSDFIADSSTEPREGVNPPEVRFLENLKLGVEQTLVTKEQAVVPVQQLATGVYLAALAERGPQEAKTATQNFLQEGVQVQLYTAEEVEQIETKVHPVLEALVECVVANVVQYKVQNPEARPAALDQKVVDAAQELIQQGKVDLTEEALFLNMAKERLDEVAVEMNARVQETQEQADVAAAQRAQEEAAAVAEAQKIEAQQNLFDALKNFLGRIEEKQAELQQRYGAYDKQAHNKMEYLNVIRQILQTPVRVGKREMTVLDAYAYRNKKMAEINSSKRTPDEQLEAMAKFDQGLGAEVVAVIIQVHKLEMLVQDLTKAMSETLHAIDALDLVIGADLKSYAQLASKSEKKKLDKDQRAEIEKREECVFAAQKALQQRYRKAHNLSPFANLPSETVEAASVDSADLLRPPVVVQEKAPSLVTKLWNSVTAPFNYLVS